MMTRYQATLFPETMINHPRMMLEHKISGLPVVDDEGQVVGILVYTPTDRIPQMSTHPSILTVQVLNSNSNFYN